MATRANISVYDSKRDTWVTIYTHWDGYPKHHYPILVNNYNTEEKALALVSLGDISILDESIEKPEGHTDDTPAKGCTVYYGRDRGDKDVNPVETRGDLIAVLKARFEEYHYTFRDGSWEVWEDTESGFRLLTHSVLNDERVISQLKVTSAPASINRRVIKETVVANVKVPNGNSTNYHSVRLVKLELDNPSENYYHVRVKAPVKGAKWEEVGVIHTDPDLAFKEFTRQIEDWV